MLTSGHPPESTAKVLTFGHQPGPLNSSEHPDFELEGSARSVVQFEGVLPEAAQWVAYAPIDPDGQVSLVVDVPSEVYKLVRLVVHLARCLYAECGGGLYSIPCVNT